MLSMPQVFEQSLFLFHAGKKRQYPLLSSSIPPLSFPPAIWEMAALRTFSGWGWGWAHGTGSKMAKAGDRVMCRFCWKSQVVCKVWEWENRSKTIWTKFVAAAARTSRASYTATRS